MPALIRDYRSSSSSERSFNANAEAGNPQVVDDVDYPALSFPGYAEKPLGEQLEPIAVVGMGKHARSLSFGWCECLKRPD
jgi:hypothetical protein